MTEEDVRLRLALLEGVLKLAKQNGCFAVTMGDITVSLAFTSANVQPQEQAHIPPPGAPEAALHERPEQGFDFIHDPDERAEWVERAAAQGWSEDEVRRAHDAMTGEAD